jgi:Ribosomal protein L16p/L10e
MLAFLSNPNLPTSPTPLKFIRFRSQLAPKNVKYIKRQKGVIPIPTGGSVKGTTLTFGDFGIRVKGNGGRLSADQLTVAEDVLKRKIKIVKGAKVYMRVFPSTPVSVKVRIIHFALHLLCHLHDLGK